MNNATTVQLTTDPETTIGVGSTDGVGFLTFDVETLRWVQVSPAKLREIAAALEATADEVEAAA